MCSMYSKYKYNTTVPALEADSSHRTLRRDVFSNLSLSLTMQSRIFKSGSDLKSPSTAARIIGVIFVSVVRNKCYLGHYNI